jgi:2-polyprenyl-3-methyl-5-hydroxy-6-metoxy-1,4-benzoquinol methylase
VGFPKRIYGNHELTYPAIGNTLRLQYLQCTECGLVGINPLTKFSDIDKRSFDGERNIVAWVDVEYTEYEADKLNAIRIIYDQYEFESYRQENRILDVSCGPGVSLSWLRDEKHWNVYGIDPDLHSVRMARTLYGLEIGNGLIVDVDVPDDYFDLIVMDNSLEHTFNPLETLLIAFRKLRKNGGLFIFVPNSEGLSTQYLDANTFWGHWFFYSPKVLTRMLQRIGYEVLKLIAIQNPVNPALANTGVKIADYRDDLAISLSGADQVLSGIETRRFAADFFNLMAVKSSLGPKDSAQWSELLSVARESTRELSRLTVHRTNAQ